MSKSKLSADNAEGAMTELKPCLTIAALNRLKPCPNGARRVRAALRKLNPDKHHCFDAAEARAAGCAYDDIVWVASAVAMRDEAVARRLVGYVNDCAIKTLPIFEECWPDDDRPRKAILATTGWLAGRVSEEDWSRAARAARAARLARAARTTWAAWDAWDVRAAGAAWAAWAAWDAWAAGATYRNWQFSRLIYWLTADRPKTLRMPRKPTKKEAV